MKDVWTNEGTRVSCFEVAELFVGVVGGEQKLGAAISMRADFCGARERCLVVFVFPLE